MRRITKLLAPLMFMGAAMLNAGALYIEVSSAAANAEAKGLRAAMVARVTSCHEPEKSVVSANLIRVNGHTTEKTPLRVVALKTPGNYAIVGDISSDSVVDVMVTNPQFPNYEPHVLVGGGGKEARLASAKHFQASPTDDDVKGLMQR